MGITDEDLRHAGAPGHGDHALALGRVQVHPHFLPRQAPALQEVLGRHAITATGGGVDRDRGIAVAQGRLRKLADVRKVPIWERRRRFSSRRARDPRINHVFTLAPRTATPMAYPRAHMRPSLAALPLTLALALALSPGLGAQERRALPDIGSSAGSVLSARKSTRLNSSH